MSNEKYVSVKDLESLNESDTNYCFDIQNLINKAKPMVAPSNIENLINKYCDEWHSTNLWDELNEFMKGVEMNQENIGETK